MEVGSSGINAEFNPQWALLLELDGKLLCADQFCASLFKLSNRICRRLHREFEMLSEPKNHTLLESTRHIAGSPAVNHPASAHARQPSGSRPGLRGSSEN